jgi:hypothetical protein
MTQDQKREISIRLREMYAGNTGYYRNDTGNGSAGPAYITINDKEDLAHQLRELLSGRIVGHDEMVNDGQTAAEFIQEAINDHGDTAEVTEEDLIVEVENDNGWTGYYWVYEI